MKKWSVIAAAAAALLATGAVGCMGHSVVRSEDPSRAMVVNLGKNRYVYSTTTYEDVAAREVAARPTNALAAGDREVATITVKAEHSGFGGGGLRKTSGEFHADLGLLAAELGGTHFLISDETAVSNYIGALTATVIVRTGPFQPAPPTSDNAF